MTDEIYMLSMLNARRILKPYKSRRLDKYKDEKRDTSKDNSSPHSKSADVNLVIPFVSNSYSDLQLLFDHSLLRPSLQEAENSDDERKLRFEPQHFPEIYFKSATSQHKTLRSMEKINALKSKSSDLLDGFSQMEARLSKLKIDVDKRTMNFLSRDNSLFRNLLFIHSSDLLWNSCPATVTKMVEIHNGRKFVRFKLVGRNCFDHNFSMQGRSEVNIKVNNLDCKSTNPSYEFFNDTAMINSDLILIHHHKILNDKNIFWSNPIGLEETISSSPFENWSESSSYLISSSPNISSSKLEKINIRASSGLVSKGDAFQVAIRGKITPTEMYQICYVPDNSGRECYIWEDANNKTKNDLETDFNCGHSTIAYLNTCKNSDSEISDTSSECILQTNNERPCSEYSQNISSEYKAEKNALNDEILNCRKILNRLERTYEMIRKEIYCQLPQHTTNKIDNSSKQYVDCRSSTDFDRKDLTTSLDSQVKKSDSIKIPAVCNIPKLKDVESIGMLTVEQNAEADDNDQYCQSFTSMKSVPSCTAMPLHHIKPFNEANVNFLYKNRVFNECDDEYIKVPSEETFMLLENILLRIEKTYESVSKEVYSWLSRSDTGQKDWTSEDRTLNHDTNSNKGVELIPKDHNYSTNDKYIMTFKGRNTDFIEKNKENCLRWDSDTAESSSSEAHEETESELDDSESSLEGSFRNHRVSDSRGSTTSSDSNTKPLTDDFDELPRFALPPRKLNNPKFHLTTEFLENVSVENGRGQPML